MIEILFTKRIPRWCVHEKNKKKKKNFQLKKKNDYYYGPHPVLELILFSFSYLLRLA